MSSSPEFRNQCYLDCVQVLVVSPFAFDTYGGHFWMDCDHSHCMYEYHSSLYMCNLLLEIMGVFVIPGSPLLFISLAIIVWSLFSQLREGLVNQALEEFVE